MKRVKLVQRELIDHEKPRSVFVVGHQIAAWRRYAESKGGWIGRMDVDRKLAGHYTLHLVWPSNPTTKAEKEIGR